MAANKPAGGVGRATLALVFRGTAADVPAASDDPAAPSVTVLSSRPDMVSGGDALVEIKLAPGVPAQTLEVTLNGRDVTKAFHQDSARRRSLIGLVEGLLDGRNSLVAKAGSSSTTLYLTNYPI